MDFCEATEGLKYEKVISFFLLFVYFKLKTFGKSDSFKEEINISLLHFWSTFAGVRNTFLRI